MISGGHRQFAKLHCQICNSKLQVRICLAHRGLLVGFLLLWYSVLFTVETLSLLYTVGHQPNCHEITLT